MITNAEIAEFRTYVKSLDLKFPVASIAKATNYSKGNVSDFISGAKQPSENFLKAFYEKFPKRTMAVIRTGLYVSRGVWIS